ncbi:eb7cc3e5-6450-4179-9802-440928590fdb [Sclerotinia trifoliorum]|uniref:Eb7cc3e5-6450-4179-9802-440928590fdb n=1 Tax=Sclerotinia trifoliorum TaxID=28548 RepID=A0A8H2VZX6_9HELO|nr:eb7cc3e5-6450-4179-9802-440928590fdb [Sclerotinia trifoliorum]
MPITSLFKKLRSHTSSSDLDTIRQQIKSDKEYHSESNPTYLKLLLAASSRRRRPIKTSSIPLNSWNYTDQEIWLFRILVEICNRPDYNAYDIVKNWSIEHELDELYELDIEEWSKVLGSRKDASTVHGILRKAEEKKMLKKCNSGFWSRRKDSSFSEKPQDSCSSDSSSLKRVGDLYRYSKT